jgi:hypothetical protein
MSSVKERIKTSMIGSRIAMMMLVAAAACLEPFPPPPGTKKLDLLVVDGFLNSSNGRAEVKLSRTLALDDGEDFPIEYGAVVQVIGENGDKFTLPEIEPGVYRTTNNNMSVGARYHLEIRTISGEIYASDQVQLTQSPQLEDLFWVREGDGITIKLDTRDPAGATRYYQWLYSETWEYDADRASSFYVMSGAAIPRDLDERLDICYRTVESSKVLVSTTSDQSGDFINDFPLVHIPAGSKKVSRLYSILVQQRALDEQGYNYWLQLQKTNENLGGLFDPLPSQVTGNIHPVTQEARAALGYFSGGGVEERRIYINFRDLPDDILFVKRQFCPIDSIPLNELNRYADGYPLIGQYGKGLPEGYVSTTFECMDCRTEGGVLTKPSFWPR